MSESDHADTLDPEVLHRLQQTELAMLKDFAELCDSNGLIWFGIGGTGIGALRHKGFIPWDDDIDIALPREDFERFLHLAVSDPEFRKKYYILNNKTCAQYPLMTTRLCLRGSVYKEKVMKDVDAPFGIFLDLYVMDNIADSKIACEIQAWTAWFWSKMLTLSIMEKPYLAFTGRKAKVTECICCIVHRIIKISHIKPALFRAHCECACRKYEKVSTRRMAFLPDTDPLWNVIDKEAMFPLKSLPFEDTTIYFTGDVEELMKRQYGDYMTIPPEEERKTHAPETLVFP